MSGDPPERIRVFLLDDHDVVRRGLKVLLEMEPDLEVVGEAATTAEAVGRIAATRPAVAVLDAKLPDGSGVDVCREVRDRQPEVACLVLTCFDDDRTLYSAITAGAAGYLLKDVRGTDLVGAIRLAAQGRSLLDPAVTARVLARLREGTPPADPRLARLSRQERRVLALVGEGKSNRQIAAEMYLTEKTVKNYVSNMLAKLGMSRRIEAALFATRLQAA
ncbi:MAG TPA: response regulator transcription factor [Frankiaceae bacterium]|nr:response regulator transcription factor [Frankiaceae bacterium]